MEITRKDIESVVTFFSSGVTAAAGSILLVDGWSTMQRIQAQGVIGQAVYQQQWSQATDDVTIGLIVILMGLVIGMAGAAEYVVSKLEKMNG